MRKGLVKKFWIFMVSLLMIIGNTQSFVFAEENGGGTFDLSNYLNGDDHAKPGLTVKVNGQELTENARTEVTYGDKINISLNWCFVNGEEPTVSENTFVYQLPNNINVNQTGVLKDDSTNAVLGTYEINPETHKITVVYTNTDFLSGTGQYASERYGYLSFEADLSDSVTNNGAGGDTTFTFPGDKTYTIHMDEDRTDECVKIEKTGGKIQQNLDGTLYADFILKITAVGTQNNVIVTDAFNWDSTMHFDGTGMSFFNDEQCTDSYTGTVVNNSSESELSYKIDSLTDQTLYAKYRVNVDKKVYSLSETDWRNNNTAKVKSSSSTEMSASKNLQYNKVFLEDKTGSYDKETEMITWEIRISNLDKVDLEGTKLVDNLKGAEGCEVDEILESNLLGINKNNLTDGTYTFPAGSKEAEYFIRYTTNKGTTSLVSKVDKINEVTIVPFGNSDKQTKYATVPVGEDCQLKKECSTKVNDSTTVEWKISFVIPKSGTGEQQAVIEEIIPDGMKFDAEKGIYDVQVNGTEDENVHPTLDTTDGLKINFGKFNASDTEKKISFKIQTIIDPVPEESSTTYTNTVKLFNEKIDAYYTYNNNNYLHYKSGEYANGQIKWTIFGKKLQTSSNEVSIVDTLPENSEYINDSVKFHSNIYYSDGDTVLTGDDISVLASEDGKTITFSFSEKAVGLMKNNDNWCVQYKTKVINPLLAVDKSFINTAKIVIDGVNFNPIQGTVYNPVQKNDIIKKEGKYDSSTAPFVEYKIVVNENGLQLNNGNNLKLTDKMGSALDYVFGSMKIDGESPTNNQVQYNSVERKLTIIVSDGVKHEIIYTAKVNLEAGKGNKLNAENAFNTVVLNGTSSNKPSDNVIINGDVVASTAGGGATGASVSIYKLDANDETKVLKGAKFTLYKVELNEDNTIKPTEKVETKETDSNGLTVFRVTKNILYKIEETEAPNEYQKDDVVHYFIFKGTEKLPEYPTEIIDGEVTKNVDVVADNQNSYSYYVTNSKIEKQFGHLTFTKVFENHEVSAEDESNITFQIQDSEGNAVTGYEAITLGSMKQADGTYSYTTRDDLEIGKSYKVVERNANQPTGWTVTTTYKVGEGEAKAEAQTVEVSETTANTEIKNSYIQLVSYTVKKEWNLNGTEGVVIPETITVQLTANGIAYGDPVVLHASESDTDNWTYTWDNLPKSDAAGEINYSVKEVEAPEGYTVSAVTDTESRVITLTNTYTNGKEVTFSKEDVAGNELPGATMSISVKNGEEVSRWVSTSEKNVVTLAPGNYTLTELTAPDGYLKAQSIDFTLDAEGKVTVNRNLVSEVVMVDEYASHDVIISKVDAANNKELAGAVLKVTDKEGNEVDKWTSEEGKNHTVTVKPGTYTFTEVSAPKGYELAESITFNVDLNGKVTIDGKEVTAVVMKDAKKPTNVQTGVHTNVGGFGALGGFSIGMAFIVLFLRKKMD